MLIPTGNYRTVFILLNALLGFSARYIIQHRFFYADILILWNFLNLKESLGIYFQEFKDVNTV